jgi:lipopolysaccharide/colanic/teichoic acid biosynthesis glycosyltransferase
MAIVAAACWKTQGRPIFFHQTRIGRDGRPFTLHKFRSMTQALEGPSVTAAGDSRITPLGAWLRRTKVDELPQLWNVLRGDMSIVGPRPEDPSFVVLWPDHIREKVLSVRPGLTDPTAIEFINEERVLSLYENPAQAYVTEVMPLKLEKYCAYVDRHTMWSDAKVVFDTFRSLVTSSQKGYTT